MMDFIPEAQTLLIVVAGVDSGRPMKGKITIISFNKSFLTLLCHLRVFLLRLLQCIMGLHASLRIRK